MVLRCYSQGGFDPQTIFEEEKGGEVDFTNKIEGIMRDFIINEIAGDTAALRKEVSCLNIIQIYLIFIYTF